MNAVIRVVYLGILIKNLTNKALITFNSIQNKNKAISNFFQLLDESRTLEVSSGLKKITEQKNDVCQVAKHHRKKYVRSLLLLRLRQIKDTRFSHISE